MGEWNGPEEKRHCLSAEEAQRGRSHVTEKRRKACALNPLKHARYAKSPHVPDEFLNCNSCKHRVACPFYIKDSECKIQGTPPMKLLARLYGTDAPEMLQVINRELVNYGLKAKHSDKLADQHSWVRLLLEFYRLRFGTREMVFQISKNLNDEEFESLLEAYRRKRGCDG